MFGFRHISSVSDLFLNTTTSYCGLEFMLVDGGINSEHTGINIIMLNYSYHGILATEYEELKNKMKPLWSQFSQWQKSTMNLIGHTVAFSEVLQSNPAKAAAKMFMPFSCIHTLLKSENICQ